MSIEKMMPMITSDFEVMPISVNAESAVYAARRDKVWHFVRHSDQNGRLIIDQFHFTRYEVAKEIQELKAALQKNWGEAIDVLCQKRYDDSLLQGDELPDEILSQMSEDIKQLLSAQSQIRVEGNEFIVPNVATHGGHAVQHSSRELMEAIQFELLINGELDPRNFGVYSAYCTYRDFVHGKGSPLVRAEGLVDGQLEYEPERVNDQYVDLAEQIQEACLGKVFWGRDVEVDRDEFVSAVHETLNELSELQQTQFVLSSGMQNDGLFLPLGLASRVLPYEGYVHFQTLSFQPDSPEEQDLRTDASIIHSLTAFDA